MDWEKIFANDATNKESISKIYKQLIQLNIYWVAQKVHSGFSIRCYEKPKRTFWPTQYIKKNKIKKWAEDVSRHFSKIYRWSTGTCKDAQYH